MTSAVANPSGDFLYQRSAGTERIASGKLEIAPMGEWGVRCTNGHPLRQADPSPPFGHYTCCGLPPRGEAAVVASDLILITHSATVSDPPWFHAGASDPLVIDRPIHLGSLRAAQDRANNRLDYHSTSSTPSRYVVQKVFLHRDVTVAGDVMVETSVSNHKHALSLLATFDVVRYVNRTEAPGSVSLLVRPEAVKSVTFFRALDNGF